MSTSVPSGKAFIYASPNFTWCEEFRLKKVIKNRDVLIKTLHAALNPLDYKVPELLPFWLMFKGEPVGHDICGIVEAVGDKVTQFRIGDCVFGVAPACAEYTIAHESMLAKVPGENSREKTAVYASLPGSGCTALYMLERSGVLRSNQPQRIVVIGASGGVGSCLVQIAKHKLPPGSTIVGVCSKKSAEYVRSIGASEIVDYTAPNFVISDAIDTGSIDAVFDTVTSPDDPDYVTEGIKLVKAATGRYLAANTKNHSEWIRAGIARQTGLGWWGRKQYELIMVDQKQEYLHELAEMVESGKLKINIDREFPFQEKTLLEALDLLRSRHVRGKVVVNLRNIL